MGSTTTSDPPAPQATADDDLLGLAFGGDTATTNSQPQSQMTSNANDDVMGLFGDMGGTNNSNDNNNAVGATDDLLGGFLGDSGSAVQQQPARVEPLLSPAGLNTQQFGGNWGSHTAELKETISCNIRSPEVFMSAMQRGANLQAVQAIAQTGEAICAGVNDGNIVLVHGKILQNGVLLTVRTKDAGFSKVCLTYAKVLSKLRMQPNRFILHN